MVQIRRFDNNDQKSVKTLITDIMSQEFQDAASAYPTDDLTAIQETYGGLGEAFFVAVNGERIVGTVAIKKEDDRIALLRRLFVDPDYRKQQIGLKLIERAVQFCDEVGYQEVIFKTTSRMQAAIHSCQKQGFIQRAKLSLGSMELLKFSCAVKNGMKDSQSK